MIIERLSYEDPKTLSGKRKINNPELRKKLLEWAASVSGKSAVGFDSSMKALQGIFNF